MSQLRVENVGKNFGNAKETIEVLKNINFAASHGETISIMGPSGTGKSTLLNIIGLLESATEGQIFLNDNDVSSLTEDKKTLLRSQNIGFVFQDHHLLPQLNLYENILLPTLLHRQPNSDNKAKKLLELVGLTARQNFFPWQVSGGERQRAAIARGLMSGNDLLLCDEPTGNLDDENGRKIIALLKEVAKKENIIVIMVTHNAQYAQEFSRNLILANGLLREAKNEQI